MNYRKGITLIELLIVLSIVGMIGVALAAVVFFSTTDGVYLIDPSDFARMMTQEGIQNAIQGPSRLDACSANDQTNASFTGVKNGQLVSGVLCSGMSGPWSKGMYIRYF